MRYSKRMLEPIMTSSGIHKVTGPHLLKLSESLKLRSINH